LAARRAHRGRAAVAAVTLVASGVACGGGGPGADAFEPRPRTDTSVTSRFEDVFGTTSTVIVASEPPVVPTTVAGDSCRGASEAGQAAAEPFRATRLIGADITVESKTCGPRVVIDFNEAGDLPSWGAEYTSEPVRDDLTGTNVSLEGDAVLRLTIGAWMGVYGVGYSGPTNIVIDDVPGVNQLRLIANTDGSATWAIGLDAEVPYFVTEVRSPPQIIVQFVPLG
jgi:hypothetical protein